MLDKNTEITKEFERYSRVVMVEGNATTPHAKVAAVDGRRPTGAPLQYSPSRLGQAARTVSRNLPTSSLSRLLSLDSDFAADSTCEEADPVSAAPRCTSVILAETC